MAARANEIYLSHVGEFPDNDREYIRGTGTARLSEWLPILRTTQSPEESMAINRIQSGAIIIAGSGMCTGGRIVHHFKHNLWREECHVVIPGFQAQGTLGRALVDGAPFARILRQRIAVRAKIHTLGGFSAHAGQSQLIQWVANFEQKPELYLIHGEREKMDTLQAAILDRLSWRANIPEPGDRIAI
ncbi:Ribonuclease [compost metagenome]